MQQYRDMGYLPDALVNFLALLGWTPDSDQEIFSREELNQQFSLDRVAKNPAVFDIEKLNWINFHYMKQLTADQLLALCLPHLQQAGYASQEPDAAELSWLKDVVWACLLYTSQRLFPGSYQIRQMRRHDDGLYSPGRRTHGHALRRYRPGYRPQRHG